MKGHEMILSLITLILLVFLPKAPSTMAADDPCSMPDKPRKVRDFSGAPLIQKTSYNIINADSISGDIGLFLNDTCPYFVQEATYPQHDSESFQFEISNAESDADYSNWKCEQDKDNIYENGGFFVKVDKSSKSKGCTEQSRVWQICDGYYSDVDGHIGFLRTGGDMSDNGDLLFQFQEVGGNDKNYIYKIRYCRRYGYGCRDVMLREYPDKSGTVRRHLVIDWETYGMGFTPLYVSFHPVSTPKTEHTISLSAAY